MRDDERPTVFRRLSVKDVRPPTWGDYSPIAGLTVAVNRLALTSVRRAVSRHRRALRETQRKTEQ